MEKWIICAAAGIAVVILWRIFSLPKRMLWRAGTGIAGLCAANALGGYIGVTLGINVWNAVVAGLLGLPGVAVLLLVRWWYGG